MVLWDAGVMLMSEASCSCSELAKPRIAREREVDVLGAGFIPSSGSKGGNQECLPSWIGLLHT